MIRVAPWARGLSFAGCGWYVWKDACCCVALGLAALRGLGGLRQCAVPVGFLEPLSWLFGVHLLFAFRMDLVCGCAVAQCPMHACMRSAPFEHTLCQCTLGVEVCAVLVGLCFTVSEDASLAQTALFVAARPRGLQDFVASCL